MNAKINVLYAQFGDFVNESDNSVTPWANLYISSDPIYSDSVVGAKPAKMSIVDSDGVASHLLAKRILHILSESKVFPVEIDVTLRQKVVSGNLAYSVSSVNIPDSIKSK